MAKFFSLSLLLVFLDSAAFSQYYYKDIVSVRQSHSDWQSYKDQKIKSIIVHSFEADEQPSKGFFCEKKISKNYKEIDTYTRTVLSGKSLLSTYFDKNGYLIKSEDSSESNVSISTYQYDANNNLLSISTDSRSSDDDYVTSLNETHQYIYNDKGELQKMLRIRNQKDSSETVFEVDEKGNVIDEKEIAVDGSHFYYYYDDRNRLTDVVRYSFIKQKMLPDFIFQYNEQGQVSQMIESQEGVASDYNIWNYVYDDGLRIKEKCYSKDKQLLGYLEYEYLDK